MMQSNRRTLIKALAAAGLGAPLAASLNGCSTPSKNARPHVVVIGGGFGGATAAKYLRRFSRNNIDVTLIEPKQTYMTCPGSNWYLAGLTDVPTLTHDYEALKTQHGVKVIHAIVSRVDADAQSVTLQNGETLNYDRLVMSPGIDFVYDGVPGYSEAASEVLPHAYQAGPQTELLYQQIRAMRQGGTFLMIAPPNPFRCPPGPYERVSMIAAYFKEHNPTAKIIVLDPKTKFSKQALFVEGWHELYGSMIEWYGKNDGAIVEELDVENKTVSCELDTFKADVINVIPPQKAAKIAFDTGLTDATGWCPVNQETFESTQKRGIFVIGDASIAGQMPKSGHSASSHGKMCAAAIVSQLNNWAMPRPKNANTCYSLVSANYGISIAGVYEMQDGIIKEIAGGVSQMGASTQVRKMEADYARGWYKSITADVWKS